MSKPFPPMTGALWVWPPQAAVARPMPKSKIFAHAKPDSALRALFTAQVDSITWAYKLAPETINLPASPSVPEIEIFEITLKIPELNHAVLSCIDRAIPFPILYNLRFEGYTQPVAAYKRFSEVDPSKWVVSDYHEAPWQADGFVRPGLPIALDLQGLYELLLRQHLSVPARAGESLRDQLERMEELAKKQAEERKLTLRLHQEKQFNRKVEINAQLRTIRLAVDSLKN